MGFKEKLLKFAGPEGWIAAKAMQLRQAARKKPGLAAGVAGAAVGAGAAAAMRTPAPVYAPAYSAPVSRGKLWGQPAVILVVGFLIFLYLRNLGFNQMAFWVLFPAITAALVSIIFKEPQKALIVLLLPLIIWFLSLTNMMTPFWSTFAVVAVGLIMLLSFDVAREFINKTITVLVYWLGAVIIFLLSAWGQMQMGVVNVHIITTTLTIGYFVWVLTRQTRASLKLIAILLNLLFFTVLFFQPLTFGAPGSPFYEAAVSQRSAWVSMFEKTALFGKQIAKEVTLPFFSTYDIYVSGVEAKSDRPLGVRLLDVGATSKFVREDDRVDLFATLQAESFEVDKPLIAEVKCYEEGKKDDVTKQGVVKPQEVFEVRERDERPILCNIDADDLGVGPHQVALEVTFDFMTSSFLRAYFMDRETILLIKQEQRGDPQKHVLDKFAITDRQPGAIFSGGPLKIKMGAGAQPVGLVQEEPEFGPVLTVKFERNWQEGEFAEFTSLKITVPPGLVIRDERISKKCTGGGLQEQVCVVDGEELKKLIGRESPVVIPKEIHIPTEISQPDGISTILAGDKMAIRSFKVDAEYTYRIEKLVPVTVTSRGIA